MSAETDVLRKQIEEEVQAEHELQLREMRRQKNLLEEELEEATSKLRSEKRRLNEEIERLENQLASKGIAFLSGTRGQDAEELEQKMRQATADWNAERERLISQIARLQGSVAEAIERSSNPIRSSQTLRDQYESKLYEANTQRLEVEQQLLRAKASWDEEKKTLIKEVMKLRRPTPGVLDVNQRYEKLKGRSETVEETRIRELETELSEARTSMLQYHETTMRSAEELANASKEAQTLKRTVAEMKEQVAAEEAANIRTLPVPHARFDLDAINTEVARVEGAIEAIEKVLVDPSMPVSAMSHKNAEKAELDAYLRGILFSIGRGRTL